MGCLVIFQIGPFSLTHVQLFDLKHGRQLQLLQGRLQGRLQD